MTQSEVKNKVKESAEFNVMSMISIVQKKFREYAEKET